MSAQKVKSFKNFEKDLKRLEEVVKLLEDNECSLDDSIKLFQEGIELSKNCRATLVNAEQTINNVLSSDEDGNIDVEKLEIMDDDEPF